MIVSSFKPLAPDRSGRHFLSFDLRRETTKRERIREAWAREGVVAEEIALCEAVQRGVRQRGHGEGNYVAGSGDEDERALHAFHHWYWRAMHGE